MLEAHTEADFQNNGTVGQRRLRRQKDDTTAAPAQFLQQAKLTDVLARDRETRCCGLKEMPESEHRYQWGVPLREARQYDGGVHHFAVLFSERDLLVDQLGNGFKIVAKFWVSG